MKFRTEIEVSPFPFSINHNGQALLMGSCFTSNIGDRLQDSCFKTLQNPFGITFNPVSLANQVSQIIKGNTYSEKNLIKHQNHFLSFDHHSSFNDHNVAVVLEKINVKIKQAKVAFENAHVLFLSLGSAWVWERKENKQIVNNCHKIPSTEFNKRILNGSEIKESLERIVIDAQQFNPNLNIVFTLSPVRHWRHGAVENTHSKSLLHAAIQDIVKVNSDAHYFPSYEIMMDDLRDYRFYTDDLLHPSNEAINYIWNKFGDAFFTEKTVTANALIGKIRKMQSHKIMAKDDEAVSKFEKKLTNRISELKTLHGITLSTSKTVE